jgi:hypothetical protein
MSEPEKLGDTSEFKAWIQETVAKIQDMECSCHREEGSHELCCGHEGGRNPDCPIHGDGSTS